MRCCGKGQRLLLLLGSTRVCLKCGTSLYLKLQLLYLLIQVFSADVLKVLTQVLVQARAREGPGIFVRGRDCVNVSRSTS